MNYTMSCGLYIQWKKVVLREAPIMLTYRSEAVLPIEVAIHTYCLTIFQEALNNPVLWEALDLLPSVRGDVLLPGTLQAPFSMAP